MARRVPGYVKGTGAREVGKARANMRKKTRDRSGPGYDTDKSNSRYKFDIHIQHGQLDLKLSEARRDISNFVNNVNRMFMYNSKVPGLSASDFINITLEPRRNSNLQTMTSKIDALMKSDALVDSMYKNLASDIGRVGVSEIRDGIKKPANPPRSFRYETGDMYNSVTYDKRKTATATIVSVGWISNFYKYFDFQERGIAKDKDGNFQIGPMDAIKRGYRATTPKSFELMSRFLNNYTKSGGFSGRYTR